MEINNIKIGNGSPFILIAGPCVVEGEQLVEETCAYIKEVTDELGIPFIYKSSYKKANRTSIDSFTGLDERKSLETMREVCDKYNVPFITDVHKEADAEMAAEYADLLQIPAFLCRQTDLLTAAGRTGKPVNIKKGQFMAPEDMNHAAAKVASTGNKNILLTERGTTFGYHNLVVDMRSFVIMKETGYPVVMDATHSVQRPSTGSVSGGAPEFIAPLARAAAAVGIDALFLEVHPEPSRAMSDAGSQLKMTLLKDILIEIQKIDNIIKKSE